jgi:endonuclease YncB( thermonuclease family)
MALAADAPKPAITLPCKVVSTHDGDTLTAEVTLRLNVRLKDTWAKELNQSGGKEAAERMHRLANGKSGTLEIPLDGADNVADVLTLGRVLGRVWIDGKDVGAVMVSEGLATKTKQK